MIFTRDNNNRIIKINFEFEDIIWEDPGHPLFSGVMGYIVFNNTGYGSNEDPNFIDLTYCQEICNSTETSDNIIIYNLNTQNCLNTIKLTNFKQNVNFSDCDLLNAKMWDENIASNQEIVNHNVFYTSYYDLRFYNCILPTNCYLIFTEDAVNLETDDIHFGLGYIRGRILMNYKTKYKYDMTVLFNHYISGDSSVIVWRKAAINS